jgi:hypothetical protein
LLLLEPQQLHRQLLVQLLPQHIWTCCRNIWTCCRNIWTCCFKIFCAAKLLSIKPAMAACLDAHFAFAGRAITPGRAAVDTTEPAAGKTVACTATAALLAAVAAAMLLLLLLELQMILAWLLL